MIASNLYKQIDFSNERSFLRSASIVSFFIHVLIIGTAVYGLPKFGRQLPPDLTIISFEMLKVVEETNLEEQKPLNQQKVQKDNEINDIQKIKTEGVKTEENKTFETPSKKPVVVSKKILPSEKPSIPVSPSEKPAMLVSPVQKPKVIEDKNVLSEKPENALSVSSIKKPISKPQIQKEKAKANKNRTNPNALTSVLKTLEKIKETQAQKKIEEVKKNQKEEIEKQKRKNELETMKNLVTSAVSSKPKNLLKPFGVSEIDLLKRHIANFWTPPIGAAGAENLIVDIFMEFNKEGYVLKAQWVNKGLNANNSFYKAAANAAIRAVKDAEPMPLPSSKFSEWKTLIFRFDPATMFGNY